jgi:transposase
MEDVMERRYDYSPEFRAEAVKLVTEQGFSQSEAARRLSIPKGTIANWMAAYRKGQPISSAPGAASVAELERENAHLRKQLAQVQMEREILKKATAYFARESLQGTRS